MRVGMSMLPSGTTDEDAFWSGSLVAVDEGEAVLAALPRSSDADFATLVDISTALLVSSISPNSFSRSTLNSVQVAW